MMSEESSCSRTSRAKIDERSETERRKSISKMSIIVVAVNLLLFTSSLLLALATPGIAGPTSSSSSSNSLLASYDQQASSSAFGEPIFRLEPPNEIELINTKGATILCLASGSPRPKITWYSSGGNGGLFDTSSLQHSPFANGADQQQSVDSSSSSSRPIGNITNLRQISQNGAALRLLPFSETEYRPEVHSTEYKCVASNHIATIQSRSVLVQAAIANDDQQPESADKQQQQQKQAKPLRVADEFVTLGSPAVLKCRRPDSVVGQSSSSSLSASSASSGWPPVGLRAEQPLANNRQLFSDSRQQLRTTTEWFTSDGIRIQPGEINKGNKFTAFPTGELHLSSVEMTDLRRTYGCRQQAGPPMQIMSSQSSLSSSGQAQLILLDQSQLARQTTTDTDNKNQPQVLHTTNQIISSEHQQTKSQLVDPQQSAASSKQSTTTMFESGNSVILLAGEQSDPLGNKLLLLPCALRSASFGSSSSESDQDELRWFFQPAQSAGQNSQSAVVTPTPLDQWAAANSIPLIYIQQQQQQQQQQNFTTKQSRYKPSIYPQQPQPINRFLVGPTYLAIEWPQRANSGRYFGQLIGSSTSAQPRTLCDINVIVRQPIEVSLVLATKQQQQQLQQGDALAQTMAHSDTSAPSVGWFPSKWFGFSGSAGIELQARQKRRSSEFDEDPVLSRQMMQVRGRSLINTPPILLVGQRLQLECRGRGYPIESLRWFRNGQPINTQSSNDFQVEIRSSTSGQRSSSPSSTSSSSLPSSSSQTSSLIIRQLQPKDMGLSVFECFAFGSLANEQVRASQCVLILDRQQLELGQQTRSPICAALNGDQEPESMPSTSSEEDNNNEVEDEEFWQPTRGNTERPLALLRRHNPLHEILLLESEPVELLCPQPNSSSASASASASPSSSSSDGRQVEWYRSSSEEKDSSRRRNFNQLFSGDSRFVINGSSLQIRSPLKRHDESLYFCVSKTAHTGPSSSGSSLAGQLHQSSLAAQCLRPRVSPDQQPQQQQPQQQQQQQQQPASNSEPGSLQLPALADGATVSSISIRIVAKPKIDPFEFSRNLEEGMRAGVLCAVISGQSPVDISWFKDGQPLEVDEQMSVDQSNGFSSTLTFLRIRPAHSGLYTCVAANAFAAANHSSRLLVNVAPYFIEPPKSSKAILNTNVIVNCRAGGQPSPQIRWRKLVPLGAPTPGTRQLTSPGGGQLGPPSHRAPVPMDDLELGQQMAPLDPNQNQTPNNNNNNNNHKFEFRIVTSNSHIQVLENGSMIIKDVDLSDASRYVCQAFNGINPSLSQVIDLSVLSPAQFDANYETVSVKRDSLIKFSCIPRGDQPIRIEWRKESSLLVPASELQSNSVQEQVSKYTEVAYLATSNSSSSSQSPPQPASSSSMRHSSLLLSSANRSSVAAALNASQGVKSSELYINFADRADTGTFTCVASNAYGKDELTYRLIVQEAPDTPLNVNVQTIQSNSLKLIWQAPFDGNLPIGHYVIEFRRLPLVGLDNNSRQQQQQQQQPATNEWQRTIVASGKLAGSGITSDSLIVTNTNGSHTQTLHSVVLRQLAARSTYNIRVAAVNGIGQSNFSPHLTVTTAEEPPTSRPNDLRAQAASSGSIKVLWRGPSLIDEQAPVKGYYISHRKLTASPALSSAAAAAAAKQEAAEQQQRPWISTSSISASNVSNNPMLMSDSLVAARQQPVDLGGGGGGGGSGDFARMDADSKRTFSMDSYEFQLNDLERNAKYEIRVQPYNSAGLGPASETVGQTLRFDRPSQPILRLVAAKRQSLELKWSLSLPANTNRPSSVSGGGGIANKLDDETGQPLMGFSLFYKYEYDEWQEIQLGLIYHYIIENLRCGNKYQIYLSAFNANGRSDPSDVLNARTEGNSPVAPTERARFVQSNMSEVVLDMGRWQSGGCPISSFMVQFKRLHEPNWFILSEGSQQFATSDRITIPDLVPATWYKLLVTATNEAGRTNAEYLFSTLTPSGEPIGPPYLTGSDDLQHSGHHSSPGGWGLLGGSARSPFLSGLSQLFAFQQPTSGGGGLNSDGGFLLPMSCILLLVISSLAGYLYYSRAGSSVASGQHQQSGQQCSLKSQYPSRGGGEKQFVSQSDATTYQIQHNLLQSLPLDAALEANSVLLHTQNSPNHYAATLGKRGQRASQQAMKLLSSGNLFHTGANQQQQQPTSASNCTSSSMSTNSTNCFDAGSSSQGSTCGGGGGGLIQSAAHAGQAKAKLQLIDESSLMMASPSMMLEQQSSSFANDPSARFFQSNSAQNSPARTLYSLNRAQQQQHVDVVGESGHQLENGDLNNQRRPMLFSQLPNQRASLLSTSFASAADLLQRQQQQQQQIYFQQQQSDEPIYQRLDKFQPNKQQHFATTKCNSQTLRLNHHQLPQTNQLDDAFKSLTLHRNQFSFQQQQQQDYNTDNNNNNNNTNFQIDPSMVACPPPPGPLAPLSYQGYAQQADDQQQQDYQHELAGAEMGQCQNC